VTGPGSFSSVKRLARLLILLVFLLGLWWILLSLGHILHHEDPLAKADVIFVLGGSRIDRIAEAGDLYLEGWAPRILLSRQFSEGGEVALRERGITVPAEVDIQRTVLVNMGVPSDAVEALTAEQVTTATEGDALVDAARAHNWSHIIVVTSKLHTARARLAVTRRFAGTSTRIVMRASRHDRANVDRWWETRSDSRFALFEAQRMLAYWVGVAD